MTEQGQSKLEIRRLSPAEWGDAYPVIAQLRSLGEADFLERVRRQSHSGYELVAALQSGKIIGVLGMTAVFLDARPDAVPFYEREDYLLHPTPSMKKVLGPAGLERGMPGGRQT